MLSFVNESQRYSAKFNVDFLPPTRIQVGRQRGKRHEKDLHSLKNLLGIS